MKKKLTIGLILLSVQLLAQDDQRIHWGIHLTPTIIQQQFDESEATSSSQFALGGGIDVYFDLSSWLQLKTGLGYNHFILSLRNYSISFGCDFDGERADPFNSWIDYQSDPHFLSIPLETRFKILGKENHLYTKVGVELLLTLEESSQSYLYPCGDRTILLENRFSHTLKGGLLFTRLGIGSEFKLFQKLKAITELQVGYTPIPIYTLSLGSTASTPNSHLLDFGLLLGCRF